MSDAALTLICLFSFMFGILFFIFRAIRKEWKELKKPYNPNEDKWNDEV